MIGVAAMASPSSQAATLETVKTRDQLICGINPNLPGFGQPDKDGEFKGFNADICRAIAAAVLGDPAKVKFVPLTATIRFQALMSGEVDLLTHNSTWTMQRDTAPGLHFTGVTFFDGQSFLVKKSAGITSVTRARRRLGVHPARLDERAQRRRFLPRPQAQIRDRVLRERRRRDQGLRATGAATCSPPTLPPSPRRG